MSSILLCVKPWCSSLRNQTMGMYEVSACCMNSTRQTVQQILFGAHMIRIYTHPAQTQLTECIHTCLLSLHKESLNLSTQPSQCANWGANWVLQTWTPVVVPATTAAEIWEDERRQNLAYFLVLVWPIDQLGILTRSLLEIHSLSSGWLLRPTFQSSSGLQLNYRTTFWVSHHDICMELDRDGGPQLTFSITFHRM